MVPLLKNMPHLARLVAAGGLALLVAGCAGTTPSGSLSDDDISRRTAARAQALEYNKTGEAANWQNPATGNLGTVVPTRTYRSAFGEDCREFQETVTVAGDTDVLKGTACRTEQGTWTISRGPYRRRPYDDDFYDPYWHYGYRYGHFGYWSRPFP